MTITKVYALTIGQDNRLKAICGRDAREVSGMSTPAEDMDAAVRAHCEDYGLNPNDAREYVAGFRAVAMNHPNLAARYAGVPQPGSRRIETPADEVDRRTRAYMREKNEKDYSIALDAVLSADSDLKEAYAR